MPKHAQPQRLGHRRPGESGQAVTEFVVMMAMMVVVVLTLFTLLGVLDDYSFRILSLIGLKYP